MATKRRTKKDPTAWRNTAEGYIGDETYDMGT